MDWRNTIYFGSYIFLLTALVVVTGLPHRNHGKNSQHSSSLKTKRNKQLQQPINQIKEKKSTFFNKEPIASALSTEDAKKKGTIRISGPWHTDSGLDRNVDPMEDSYVKKIISSNEGLNFNKDMAEAGEVFDVNGIEDFYDRNALITYEVNGHEIPVHLKQKLTPQSQTMFPEYGHDSPTSADTVSRNGHAYKQRTPNGHKATTFYGMSLKDMPEYKVRDTPSVGEKHHDTGSFTERERLNGQEDAYSRHRLGNANSPNSLDSSVIMPFSRQNEHREMQSQVDKFASEYEQANEFGQEDAKTFSNRIHNNRPNLELDFHRQEGPPDSSVAGYDIQPKLNRFASRYNGDKEPLLENKIDHLKAFASHKGFGDQEALLEELARLKMRENRPVFASPSHSEKTFQKRPSDSVQFSDRPKPSLSDNSAREVFKAQKEVSNYFDDTRAHSDDQGVADSRGVGKEYDGGRLAPAVAEGSKIKDKENIDDSNKFFEQLEKIDEEKQKTEKEKQIMAPGNSAELIPNMSDLSDKVKKYSDDNERSKAKDKLLKILGDLTSKLKGMEAAVKDTHTDERRESPSASDINEAKQEPIHQKELDENHERDEHKSEYAQVEGKEQQSRESEAKIENGKSPMDHAQQYPWESKHETEQSEQHAPYSSSPNESEGREGGQEHVSRLISNLKDHGRPFIFNTEEIDYKDPSYEEKAGANDESNQNKGHVLHHGNEREGHLLERPIVSSFYHNADQNSEFDTHLFHAENDLPSINEVTPTQRDGGRKNHKESAETVDEPDKKLNGGMQTKDTEAKTDPDDDLPDYNEVKDAAIFEENFIRKKYHSPNLRWSDDMSDEAQKEADELSEEKTLDLNKKTLPKGMNVALLPLNSLNVGKDSADLWQKEATKFDFVSPVISKKNSDFAQMVWKTAKEFGLGVAKSKDKENWIVIAKYDSPAISEYEKLKANIESDIPIQDPYSDIARRTRIRKVKK